MIGRLLVAAWSLVVVTFGCASGETHTERMVLQQHSPADVFPPYANYAHAVEVPADSRMLFISGLNGFERDGQTMPEDWLVEIEAVAAAD